MTEEHKKRIGLGNTGKVKTLEVRLKMSKSHKGKKMPPISEETRKRMSLAQKGKIMSKEVREKIRKAQLGRKRPEFSKEKNPNWKGGTTSQKEIIRKSVQYKLWRKAVFERDNWTCIWCGKRGGNLEADHIKRFSDYPELRFAIDNGRTLCRKCHLTTETFGSKKQLLNSVKI